MKVQLPDYGVFLHWPQPGVDWIHEDDVDLVSSLIPSTRVFRRDSFDGTFYHLRYGDKQFRTQPVMWLSVDGEGFDVGQWVEIASLGLSREPFVGQILEVRYDRRAQRIRYTVRRSDMTQPTKYTADQLKSIADRNVLRDSDFDTNQLPVQSQPQRIIKEPDDFGSL